MKKEPTTLRDIAINLGVSISTVSRALSGAPEVNDQTKEAVLKAAKKLNYEPNHVAQSLRSNKTKTIGIIVPNLISHFFSATISGIQNMAAEKGYNVMICQSNESFATEVSNVQMMMSHRVDGLLISLSKETETYDHLHPILNRGIPLVFFDRVCEELNTSRVMVDDHDGAFKATEHLIETGCRRIAHISGPEQLSISKNRRQGYLDALQKHNIPVREELILHSSFKEEDVAVHTHTLLDLPNPPDAIFAVNDLVAVQAMLVIKERGMKIPEDIAMVGFTNTPVSAFIEPSLTTVAQPAYQIGHISAKHILEQINHPQDFIPQSIVLKTELIVRNSSRRKA
ncbi:LacI family DNA-binding transcriptional regulator [Nafulsella turpanensis]|uniref:LacI family DNA-binding transcriptional regulator n=1 Tax=Nafulsella turpanensis TaxID=1265690 RepID=UPI0004760B59|nr:LacI family DNA-binding transcriptional regulator [Nafulsella turpanensis]